MHTERVKGRRLARIDLEISLNSEICTQQHARYILRRRSIKAFPCTVSPAVPPSVDTRDRGI